MERPLVHSRPSPLALRPFRLILAVHGRWLGSSGHNYATSVSSSRRFPLSWAEKPQGSHDFIRRPVHEHRDFCGYRFVEGTVGIWRLVSFSIRQNDERMDMPPHRIRRIDADLSFQFCSHERISVWRRTYRRKWMLVPSKVPFRIWPLLAGESLDQISAALSSFAASHEQRHHMIPRKAGYTTVKSERCKPKRLKFHVPGWPLRMGTCGKALKGSILWKNPKIMGISFRIASFFRMRTCTTFCEIWGDSDEQFLHKSW